MVRDSGGSPIVRPCTIANAGVATATRSPSASNARTRTFCASRASATCTTKLPSADSVASAARPAAVVARDADARGRRLARRRNADDVRRRVGGHRRVLKPDGDAGGDLGRAAGAASRPAVAAYSAAPCATRVIGSWPSAMRPPNSSATRARSAGITVGPPTSTTRATSSARAGSRSAACARGQCARDQRRRQRRPDRRASARGRRRRPAAVDRQPAARSPRARRATARSWRPRTRPAAWRSARRCTGGRPASVAAAAARELAQRPSVTRRRSRGRRGSCRRRGRRRGAAVARLEQRDVERPAAEVEDQPAAPCRRRTFSARQPAATALAIGSWISSTRSKPASRRRATSRGSAAARTARAPRSPPRSAATPSWSATSARSDFSTSADSSSGCSAGARGLERSLSPVPISRLNSAARVGGILLEEPARRAPPDRRPAVARRCGRPTGSGSRPGRCGRRRRSRRRRPRPPSSWCRGRSRRGVPNASRFPRVRVRPSERVERRRALPAGAHRGEVQRERVGAPALSLRAQLSDNRPRPGFHKKLRPGCGYNPRAWNMMAPARRPSSVA